MASAWTVAPFWLGQLNSTIVNANGGVWVLELKLRSDLGLCYNWLVGPPDCCTENRPRRLAPTGAFFCLPQSLRTVLLGSFEPEWVPQ